MLTLGLDLVTLVKGHIWRKKVDALGSDEVGHDVWLGDCWVKLRGMKYMNKKVDMSGKRVRMFRGAQDQTTNYMWRVVRVVIIGRKTGLYAGNEAVTQVV